jgi:hypothetical protein
MKNVINFEQAKQLVAALGITTFEQWRTAQHSNNLPAALPNYPEKTYPQWSRWENFLAPKQQNETLPFELAKLVVNGYNVNNRVEYRKLKKENDLVRNLLPFNPERVYKAQYTTFVDFITSKRDNNAATNLLNELSSEVAPKVEILKDFYCSFDEFKQILAELGITTRAQFRKSNEINQNLSVPTNPEAVYSEFAW